MAKRPIKEKWYPQFTPKERMFLQEIPHAKYITFDTRDFVSDSYIRIWDHIPPNNYTIYCHYQLDGGYLARFFIAEDFFSTFLSAPKGYLLLIDIDAVLRDDYTEERYMFSQPTTYETIFMAHNVFCHNHKCDDCPMRVAANFYCECEGFDGYGQATCCSHYIEACPDSACTIMGLEKKQVLKGEQGVYSIWEDIC